MITQEPNSKVCGPKDMFTEDTLKLSLTSHVVAINPIGWKGLWLLSPFSRVKGGVIVPGMKGKTSNASININSKIESELEEISELKISIQATALRPDSINSMK